MFFVEKLGIYYKMISPLDLEDKQLIEEMFIAIEKKDLKEVKKQLELKSTVRIAKKATIINMLKIILYVLDKFNRGQKVYSILIDELKCLNINNLRYYIGFLNIAQALDDLNNHHITIFKTKLNNYQKDAALLLDKNSQLKKKSDETYMMSFMVNLPNRSEHDKQTEIIDDIFVLE